MTDARPLTNWAGNVSYSAHALQQPTSVEEVQAIVANAKRVRVVGSRHSFNNIADAEDMLRLALPADLTVDLQHNQVSFSAGLTYGALAEALEPHGRALHNMASLPHISVAGAIATATHGSGDRNGNLATAVAGLELVTSSGELVPSNRGDSDFEGMVVGLGALGVVTRLTLDAEPAYEVRQVVYENLSWRSLFEHLDEIFASGYSVSVFTGWGDTADAWVKSRGSGLPDDLFGAPAARVERHPIAELDAINCTAQLGRSGRWSDRLPHFRMNFTPSSGQELQSEYFVARQHAASALEAVRGLAGRVVPLLQISELRTIAADRLWMSPEYGRDSLAIHFTWQPDQPAVLALLPELEAALAPFDARPHWGKLFDMQSSQLKHRYERLPDFVRLAHRLDPHGKFRNAWFEQRVSGPA